MDVRRCPALFYGFYVLIGVAFALVPHWSYLVPCFLFSFYANSWKQRILCVLIALMAFVYGKSFYTFPSLEEKGVGGVGKFEVESLTHQSSPFARSYVYKGILSSFETKEGEVWKRIPCRIYLKKRPSDLCDQFHVAGVLTQKGPFNYVFKPALCSPLSSGRSFAYLRFQIKERFHAHLKKLLPDKQACSFLTSMITGEIEERTLSLEFNRIGLQHILGVSGFQFVLLASILGLFLKWIFPYRIAAIFLFFLLTGYYLFLGTSPPVQRAWIAISIFLIGILANLRCHPLNALGTALGVEVLLDPAVIIHIGFQLSFLCTLAILQFYPLVRTYLCSLLPTRSFGEVTQMNLWNQHGYILEICIRESLALNLAVHLMALPALLCLFHKLSLLSLAYNLFFPLGATVSFVLTIVGLLFSIFLR